MTLKLAPVVEQIYVSLGCPVTIQFLPGKRGIHYFNDGKVDGELFRLPVIENKYTRDFIRSSAPIISLSKSIWVNPQLSNSEPRLTGYAYGIAWQEKYVAENAQEFTIIAKFHSGEDLFDAYNNGRIDSFLAEEKTVEAYLKKNSLYPIPVLKKRVHSSYLYHYLDAQFIEFMNDFSEYVTRHKPFAD
ncbi:MAG: hypothetical protein JKY12_06545 [Sneathiella sp.]|nr:hypothetical protein [Sneathiella sp.]